VDLGTEVISLDQGEIVFGRDNPNNGQMSILVDGAFYAGENNGFYSIYSGNNYNNKVGFYGNSSGHFYITTTDVKANGNTIWHAGNDGAGSGLDADLLDGMQPKSATGQSGSNQILRTHSNGYLYHKNWIDIGSAGLFSSNEGPHWYPDGSNGWYARSGNASFSRIRMLNNSATTFGYFYAESDNDIGILNNSASWLLKCKSNGNLYKGDEAGLIWHSANDGSGSGLDADLLDGQQGTYYRGGAGLGQNINYVASSTSTSNRGNHGAGVWAYSGYSTGSNRPYTYDATLQVMPTGSLGFELSTSWHSTGEGTLKIRALRDCCEGWGSYYDIWTSANDGSGSGLDADLLDGVQGASFLRSDANDSASGNLTFTGALSQTSGVFLSHGDQTGNLNTVWESAGTGKDRGIYPFRYQASASNSPSTNDNANWGLNIYSHGGSGGGYPYGIQLAGANASSGENSLFLRTVSNGTFGSWKRVFHEGHLPTMAEAGVTTATVEALGFLRSNTSDVMNGELNVTRNSGVTGTSVPNYDEVNIEMQTSSNHVPAISFHRGGYSATTLYEYSGELYVNAWTTRSQTGKLLSTGNEGSGGGIDADTVDGIHANAFLRTTNSPGTPGPGNQYTNISIGDSGTSYAYVQSHGSKPLKINPSGNTVDIDGGGTVTIDGPLHMANTRQISFDRGNSDFSTQVYASNHPPAGYTSTSHNYWVTLSSKGGTHVIVNTDGAYNSSENAYDHFTIWQDNISNYNARQFYVTNVGNVYAKGDVTAFQSSNMSDIRLKKDVKPIENALDIVDKLNGVTFTWKRDDKKSLGFIAQDVEKVVPELVEDKPAIDDPDTLHKTVNYANMVAILTEAVKELKAEVEELKNKKCNCNGSTK